MSQVFKDFTFTWIIENFSFFDIEYGAIIHSPIHGVKYKEQIDWEITIFGESNDDYKNVVSFIIERICTGKAVTLDFEMELCNSENEVLYFVKKKKGIKFVANRFYNFQSKLLVDELMKKMKNDFRDTLILRCRMYATGGSETVDVQLNRNCTVKSTQSLNEISYLNDVVRYESLNWQQSLTFPHIDREILSVNIEANSKHILFEIRQDIEIPDYQKFKCVISLLDRKGTEMLSCCDIFTFTRKCRVWHFPPFLKSFMWKKYTSNFLKFTFAFSSCVIFHECIDERKHLSVPASPEVCKSIPATNSLTDDFRKMLFSKENADVIFRVDGELFNAHKFVLTSRSPVFSSMFNQQMAENETGVVDIRDMDVQTLKLFLEFVYTGELKNSDWERMLALLLAAEKYQVPSLKEECSQFLKLGFNTDNVCDVVSVADMVGEQNLKVAAFDYIKENVAKVFSSPKWLKLTDKNIKLCSEIICNFSEDLKAKHNKNVIKCISE